MSKVVGHFTISHKSLGELDKLMVAKKLANFGEVLDAAINYPKGTFTQVADPVYDGLGCIVEISYDFWREADLEALAKRASFNSVSEWIQGTLCGMQAA
jgi:hypothetical protein